MFSGLSNRPSVSRIRSWPGLSRPSTPILLMFHQDVDARDERGHDGSTPTSDLLGFFSNRAFRVSGSAEARHADSLQLIDMSRFPSWPGLSRPSTPFLLVFGQDVDARDGHGHDGSIKNA